MEGSLYLLAFVVEYPCFFLRVEYLIDCVKQKKGSNQSDC